MRITANFPYNRIKVRIVTLLLKVTENHRSPCQMMKHTRMKKKNARVKTLLANTGENDVKLKRERKRKSGFATEVDCVHFMSTCYQVYRLS